ncbi:hypothetical protein CENSYa_1882 [Cenarchaeum symbiosum A]|uniref:Uncharacterized protein n=1 Tax=Cenarchaeum symbiosum (strain A) TaxID=414004 RepID=A0RYS4_CENSY|nr:hypothetical protein CENSYa_1882 [Cenarchaeum symbiosum A]
MKLLHQYSKGPACAEALPAAVPGQCTTLERELIAPRRRTHVEPVKKKKVRLLILLACIWFVITLPLPWIVGNPNIPVDTFLTILGIIGIMSVPFVMLGIVWMLKPELTT